METPQINKARRIMAIELSAKIQDEIKEICFENGWNFDLINFWPSDKNQMIMMIENTCTLYTYYIDDEELIRKKAFAGQILEELEALDKKLNKLEIYRKEEELKVQIARINISLKEIKKEEKRDLIDSINPN